MVTKNSKQRKRRSEWLSKEEHKAFIKYYNSFPTKTDAEETIGVLRQVLDNVVTKGCASPESISKIKEKMLAQVAA